MVSCIIFVPITFPPNLCYSFSFCRQWSNMFALTLLHIYTIFSVSIHDQCSLWFRFSSVENPLLEVCRFCQGYTTFCFCCTCCLWPQEICLYCDQGVITWLIYFSIVQGIHIIRCPYQLSYPVWSALIKQDILKVGALIVICE